MSEPIPSKQPNRFLRFWRTIGGGSLTLSLFIHGAVIFVGGFVVFMTRLPEKQIDFLPGGGTQAGAEASRDLAHKVQQKKRKTLSKVLPMKKLVTTSLNSTITLPDAPLDALDVPDVSSLIGGGSINGGFGKASTGGGFGTGSGMGGLSGITFKPLMMFGKELKDTRKMAVVMDVSRSMTKFLPIVARELDKVARGSPLILYFGCGLKTPPKNLEDKVRKVSDPGFNKFWQYWEGKNDMKALRSEYPNLKFDPALPMPLEPIYQQMIKRPNTYFIDFNGITYTSPALMCKEVMEADTIYWFSDFMDAVDESHIADVKKKLKTRKQKLYMHASVHGRSFEKVRDLLVLPLGGEVIDTKAE